MKFVGTCLFIGIVGVASAGIDVTAYFSTTQNPNAPVTFGGMPQGDYGVMNPQPAINPFPVFVNQTVGPTWAYNNPVDAGFYPYAMAFKPPTDFDGGEGTIIRRGQLVFHPSYTRWSGFGVYLGPTQTQQPYAIAFRAWRVGAPGGVSWFKVGTIFNPAGYLTGPSSYTRPDSTYISYQLHSEYQGVVTAYNDGINSDSTAVDFSIVPQTGNAPRVHGLLDLEDWVGPCREVPVKVRVFNYATQQTTEFSTMLYSTGQFDISVPGAFSFNQLCAITVKAGHWLAKTAIIESPTFGVIQFPRTAVKNGDADGDDSVSILDYLAISAVFGAQRTDANWLVFDNTIGCRPADCDLDGDDEVSILDYLIMSANFGLQGDW
jgi:hypothetical protein